MNMMLRRHGSESGVRRLGLTRGFLGLDWHGVGDLIRVFRMEFRRHIFWNVGEGKKNQTSASYRV